MPSIGFFALLGILTLRYLIFACGAYLIVCVWKRDALASRRIQDREPLREVVRREFYWSMVTTVIFAFGGRVLFLMKERGHTLIYENISDYGWTYFFLSVPLLMFLHDTYFYWTHRLMHHKWIFKWVHRVHHDSRVPSPLAAFSFDPVEAVVEATILPVLAMVIPIHPIAFLIFLMVMTVLGVVNHTGYELYFRGFGEHPIGKWIISATHHDHHHRHYQHNLGLYFTWWDRLMKTQAPEHRLKKTSSIPMKRAA